MDHLHIIEPGHHTDPVTVWTTMLERLALIPFGDLRFDIARVTAKRAYKVEIRVRVHT